MAHEVEDVRVEQDALVGERVERRHGVGVQVDTRSARAVELVEVGERVAEARRRREHRSHRRRRPHADRLGHAALERRLAADAQLGQRQDVRIALRVDMQPRVRGGVRDEHVLDELLVRAQHLGAVVRQRGEDNGRLGVLGEHPDPTEEMRDDVQEALDRADFVRDERLSDLVQDAAADEGDEGKVGGLGHAELGSQTEQRERDTVRVDQARTAQVLDLRRQLGTRIDDAR